MTSHEVLKAIFDQAAEMRERERVHDMKASPSLTLADVERRKGYAYTPVDAYPLYRDVLRVMLARLESLDLNALAGLARAALRAEESDRVPIPQSLDPCARCGHQLNEADDPIGVCWRCREHD